MADEIIVLSDSDSRKSSPPPTNDSDPDDYHLDLPSFHFHHIPSPTKSPPRSLPRLDSGYESLPQPILSPEIPKTKARAKTKKTEEKRLEVQERKRCAEEKRRKVQQEKLLKQVERQNKRVQKPEEAVRNCTAMLDRSFQDEGYLEAIAAVMAEHEASYSVVSNPVPYSVLWERTSEVFFLDKDQDRIQSSRDVCKEAQMLVVWGWQRVVEMICWKTFGSSVQELHERFPDRKISLLVEGMERYFAFHKGKAKKGKGKEFEGSRKISRTEFEQELVEIQVLFGCTTQLAEDVQQVALTIYQFTKAIALIPYKEDKWKKLEDMDTYVSGEKKDLVAVSKEGYGLKRLWQKQLCQFNLCSLETAEAICSVYDSPVKLMEAYANCSSTEGEMLLKDIPVRRGAMALNAARKIGPELSKKVYLMFTSTDGDVLLGNA